MSDAPDRRAARRASTGRDPRPADAGSLSGASPDPVLARTPAEPRPPRTGPVREVAAGIPAVLEAARVSVREMGAAGALRVLGRMNQTDGFDCPGCAWPDPPAGARSFAEFCENGAKAAADEATTRRVGPEFFAEWSVAALSRQSDHWLNAQGRLTHPMLLREGAEHYEPIAWDDAFRLIADELNALDSPDEAVFYTSGRASNEAAFLYQLFARHYGTNNLPDCSNMCHESSGTGLSEVIGIGKGVVSLDDFLEARAILVIGQNPGTCHPRMLSVLERAKRNGCTIVSVNPLPETGLNRFKQPQDLKNPLKAFGVAFGSGTPLADLHVPVRVNGDVAFLKAVMRELLDEEARLPGTVLDHDFIRDHTEGFEAFAAALRSVDRHALVEASGVSAELIHRVAEIVRSTDRIIVTWAMGLTQHRNAVANIQEIVNLLLMRGSIGKPGAGACPVRGHSNVQGDRTVGIWDRPKPELLDALEREFGFEPPRHHGLDTVKAIEAMHAGRARVFFALGGNFLSAAPDTDYTAEALRRCRLTVQVSTKLNRSHLVTGRRALILPCLGRTERDVQAAGPQFVSVENSFGTVHRSMGRREPASPHLLSEPMIIARLAAATLGARSKVDWLGMVADYDRIRDAIERVVPGFEDYNRRVREPGGFALPNAVRDRRAFDTPTGRARFTVHDFPRHDLGPGRFLMMTIRSHDQFNTTVYGLDDRYRGIRGGRRVVLLNPEDMAEQGIEAGRPVDLTSHFEDGERTAERFIAVPYPIPRRCAATYFPEANVLVPIGSVAEKSNTPASKSVEISVRPSAAAPRAGTEARDARAEHGALAP
ncbi:MAG TPA: FdhF/YdeP family oxidoreductase [Longimicrobiales bacterium]